MKKRRLRGEPCFQVTQPGSAIGLQSLGPPPPAGEMNPHPEHLSMDRLQGPCSWLLWGLGGEGEELIPMNTYPSLASTGRTPGLDGSPGGSGTSPHSSPCFPSRGEGPGDNAELSAELDECQEESHSEPTAVLTSAPTPPSPQSPGAALVPLPCTGPSHLCVWRTRTWPSPRAGGRKDSTLR